MAKLAEELEINVQQMMLIVNRVQGELPPPLQEAIDELGMDVAALIPADENVNQLDALGQPLIDLESDSPAFEAVEALTARILGSL
jgi:CO dehydrogenase maturation factor